MPTPLPAGTAAGQVAIWDGSSWITVDLLEAIVTFGNMPTILANGKFCPLITASAPTVRAFCDGNCYGIESMGGAAATEFAHIKTYRRFGPGGAFQWVGKFSALPTNRQLAFGFENIDGQPEQGSLAFHVENGDYFAGVGADGDYKNYRLAGQDWKREKIFKIIWSPSSRVDFYVDGGLVKSMTKVDQRIPSVAMTFFIEAIQTGRSAESGTVYVKQQTLTEL